MTKYRIIYDTDRDDNLIEEFEGIHCELMDYIKTMLKQSCCNITATAIEE